MFKDDRLASGVALALVCSFLTFACGSDESTSSDDGTDPAGGDSGIGAGGSGTAGSGTSGTGAGGSGAGEACTGEVSECLDENLSRVCIDGVYDVADCSVVCSEFGFAAGSCDEGCLCDEPLSPTCDLAASAFCVCLEALNAETCTAAQFFDLYALCHAETPTGLQVACFADFVDEAQSLVDCEAAATTCLPPPP